MPAGKESIFDDPNWASNAVADNDIIFKGTDEVGVQVTAAPTGVGPAGSVKIRNSMTGGAEVVVTVGVGAGGSTQANIVGRTGVVLGVGEMGSVQGVTQATVPTGLGTVSTFTISFSPSPLGVTFSAKAGLGTGASAIVGVRTFIPLSSPSR